MNCKHYTIRPLQTEQGRRHGWYVAHDPNGVQLYLVAGMIADCERWLEKKRAIEEACVPPSTLDWSVVEDGTT